MYNSRHQNTVHCVQNDILHCVQHDILHCEQDDILHGVQKREAAYSVTARTGCSQLCTPPPPPLHLAYTYELVER
jgi:hypothetical protein